MLTFIRYIEVHLTLNTVILASEENCSLSIVDFVVKEFIKSGFHCIWIIGKRCHESSKSFANSTEPELIELIESKNQTVKTNIILAAIWDRKECFHFIVQLELGSDNSNSQLTRTVFFIPSEFELGLFQTSCYCRSKLQPVAKVLETVYHNLA